MEAVVNAGATTLPSLAPKCNAVEKRVSTLRITVLSSPPSLIAMAGQCSSFSTTIVTRFQKSIMTLAATGLG